jgi:hypothetical protein
LACFVYCSSAAWHLGFGSTQESFWLAETIKYLYLLQDPDHTISVSLADYIFTTEAHPLPMPRGPAHKSST